MNPNEVVSALRPVMHTLPSIETWYEVCRVLHQCVTHGDEWTPDEEAIVAGYLAGFLKTWPDGLATLDPYTRAMLFLGDEDDSSHPMRALYPALRHRLPDAQRSPVARTLAMHMAAGHGIVAPYPEFDCVALDPTGRYLAIGGPYVAVRDLESWGDGLMFLDTQATGADTSRGMAFHPERPWLVVLGEGALIVYDVCLQATARAMALPEDVTSKTMVLIAHGDLAIVVVSRDDAHTALTYDLGTGALLFERSGVHAPTALPDGRRVLHRTDGRDAHTLTTWEEDEVVWSRVLPAASAGATVRVHPSGASFGVLPLDFSTGASITLHEMASGDTLQTIECWAMNFAYHPSGEILTYATPRHGHVLKAACDARSVAPLDEHTFLVSHPECYADGMAYSDTGVLATASWNEGVVRLTDVEAGGPAEDAVWGVAASSGDFVVSARGDLVIDFEEEGPPTSVQRWSLADQESGELLHNPDDMMRAEFSPDGAYFVAANDEGLFVHATTGVTDYLDAMALDAYALSVTRDRGGLVVVTHAGSALHRSRFDAQHTQLFIESTAALQDPNVLSIESSSDGTEVFVVGHTRGVDVYERDTLTHLRTVSPDGLERIDACAHAENAPIMALASHTAVQTWDTRTWTKLTTHAIPEYAGTRLMHGQVACDDSGRFVAYITTTSAELVVLDARTGDVLGRQVIDRLAGVGVRKVAFVPGAPSLILCGSTSLGIRCVRWV